MSIDLSFIEDEALRTQVETVITGVTKDLFTQEQLDRRVNAAVQKQLKTNAQLEADIRKQIEDEAKLTAEQKAQKILQDAEAMKNEALTVRNRVTALDKCVAAGMRKEDAEPILNILVNADEEATNKNVDLYLQQFQSMTANLQKQMAGNIPKPNIGGNDDTVTKEVFDKMTYADKLKFKEEHPEEAKAFMGA